MKVFAMLNKAISDVQCQVTRIGGLLLTVVILGPVKRYLARDVWYKLSQMRHYLLYNVWTEKGLVNAAYMSV
jgi:hypothetical protein